ncbi:alpha-L-rhamnosidase [Loigolactobacillus coryniformis]|nr:alpha-L-rhamnosidase [Loigolactobacillus coryniformis]ATO55599.1 alfa-L-rhamnosidase [Loigolactobacillus coryniformis subsp. coryniformis KCTC 3167 = DSM 20001]
MKINTISINQMQTPIGYKFDQITIHCSVVGMDYPTELEKKLTIQAADKVVYESEWQAATSLDFQPALDLAPRTRYVVHVSLRAADYTETKATYFETGLMDQRLGAHWIGSADASVHGLQLVKQVTIPRGIKQARLYISGLGLYEAYIDGHKVGAEYLAPGFTNYNYYTQIATHDVTDLLTEAGVHTLTISLGDGWFRGKLGIKQHGGKMNQYGNALMAVAALCFTDEAGVEKVITTDATWKCMRSRISHSGIYYGEDLDETVSLTELPLAQFEQPAKYLFDRLSLPITTHEKLPVVKKIMTPSGTTVLDFGQNMAGWVTFTNRLPRGSKVALEYGEVLQDGELYRGNLRSARATFTYVSDGTTHRVRPHFTYFGFRYVKLIDFPKNINVTDFSAWALYSDMKSIGNITTNDPLVNRLFKNVLWGQKSNFLDVPTDCPQRDERLGWTGDAAIFAQTASYNMNTFSFNRKFMFDVAVEQSLHNGKVPLYCPAVDEHDGGKAVWSDVATIIPWVTYTRTGDLAVLKQNFGAMMSWVDWVHDYAKGTRNEFLWLDGDQLGDWLALDTEDILHLKGRTPDDLIASAYYYYSAKIVAQTAKLLQAKHESEYYELLANKIHDAFINEFFTGSGRLLTDTQTALALCLEFDLYPANTQQSLTGELVKRLEKDCNHLTTGFVGTPVLLPALSKNGQHELACQIFLNDDYPSWLYQVKHGATTIWERWNSIDSNGKIAENGMNSLNHYSTGAVMQWAYEQLIGIQPITPTQVTIQPGITAKFRQVAGRTELANGQVAVAWQIMNIQGDQIKVTLDIPYGATATVNLPRAKNWQIADRQYKNGTQLQPGHYEIMYTPTKAFVDQFTVYTPLSAYNQDKTLTTQLATLVPFWSFLTLPGNMQNFQAYSLLQLSHEMRGIGFPEMTPAQIDKINQLFAHVALANTKE